MSPCCYFRTFAINGQLFNKSVWFWCLFVETCLFVRTRNWKCSALSSEPVLKFPRGHWARCARNFTCCCIPPACQSEITRSRNILLGLMRILLYRECSVFFGSCTRHGQRIQGWASYGVITHHWAAHQLTEVCCSVRSTQRRCQHYNSADNMLPSCLVCMIEMQSAPPPPLCVVAGFVWQAGIARFLAHRGGWVSGLFPALRVHFRWLGGLCVIKGPSSASTQVWNAATRRCWSAFVCFSQFVATRKSWAEGRCCL